MRMENARMIVLARSSPDMEAELVRWLAESHLPDLLRVPGITRAQLMELESLMDGSPVEYRTLAIYDLEGEDIHAIVREAGSRMGTAEMPRSAALGSPNLTFLGRPIVELRAELPEDVGQ